MFKKILPCLFFFSFVLSGTAQSWVKICDDSQGCTIVNMPIGAMYRYGIAPTPDATGGWIGPSSYDRQQLITVNSNILGDPASGKVKEFNVLQTTKTQTIFYTFAATPGILKAVTIPAFIAPVTIPAVGAVLTMNLPDGLFSNCRFGYTTASDNKEYFYLICNPTAPTK